MPGSKPVNRATSLVDFMSNVLKIYIPSATMVRKIGSTAAARACTESESRLINRQMCHDPVVGAKYYEAIKGPRDAAKAFDVLKRLREESKGEEVSSSKARADSSPSDEGSSEEEEPTSRWKPKDTSLVRAKFKAALKSLATPTLKECQGLHIKGKTNKQIQDKIRTMIRQEKRKR